MRREAAIEAAVVTQLNPFDERRLFHVGAELMQTFPMPVVRRTRSVQWQNQGTEIVPR